MNAYRKEHSNGKVIFTSNGAVAIAKARKQNNSHVGLWIVILFVLVVAFAMCLLSVSNVGARSLAFNGKTRMAQCEHTLDVAASPHTPAGSNPHPMCVPHTGKNKPNKNNEDKPTTQETSTHENDKPQEDHAAVSTGNPGNDKNVGHAGEKCDKGMCEQGDHGNKGKSNSFVPFTALVALWKKLVKKIHAETSKRSSFKIGFSPAISNRNYESKFYFIHLGYITISLYIGDNWYN